MWYVDICLFIIYILGFNIKKLDILSVSGVGFSSLCSEVCTSPTKAKPLMHREIETYS